MVYVKLRKKLHKIVPEIIDLFVTPLVTVLATQWIYPLTIIGPVFSTVENYVLSGAMKLITPSIWSLGHDRRRFYAPTVVRVFIICTMPLRPGLLSSIGDFSIPGCLLA